MVAGIERREGLITSADVTMATVFPTFTVGETALIKMFELVPVIAVTVDATLVRGPCLGAR